MKKRKLLILIFVCLLSLFSCKSNSENKSSKANLKKVEIITLDSCSNELYKNHNFAIAEKNYKELTTMDTANGEYFYRFGYCQMENKKELSAIDAFKIALRLGYREYSTCLNISCSYALIHQDSFAIIYANRALLIDSSSQKAKNIIEICQKELNELRKWKLKHTTISI